MTITEELHLVTMVKPTTHTGKLEGITSVNTSAALNPICQARQQVEGSICQHCYAESLLHMRKGLADRTAQNGDILQNYLISDDAWSFLPISTLYARIESFGDVANVTQARNYIRIIRSHPQTRWGIWSKNAAIWAEAFQLEGKPTNCTYVHSSMMLGQVDELPSSIVPYADHRFTVWPKGTDHEITCGGRRCMTCLRCYRNDTSFDVDELKK